MSGPERPVPPAGEEIHLPSGSAQPVLMALFITVFLLGLTTSPVLLVIGAIGFLWVLIRWVVDARREMAELPVHEPGPGH